MIELAIGAILLFFLALLIYVLTLRVYRKVKLARTSSPRYHKVESSKMRMRENSRQESEKTEVIGMVKCEYCGALMPQLSMLCPNCGAARKK